MVYWLGIRGYIQSQMFPLRKQPGGNRFSSEVVTSTIGALNSAMIVAKLYHDPALTVAQLSLNLKIPQKTISGVLNQHLNKSFNEYINEFRISEVKQKLIGPGNEHLTIAGIGFECGFNSQATFQRAFKLVTGMSPSEFLERHRNQTREIAT
jgi:AraC-like DNA-binding protein